jgi:hypothetical protein
MILRIRYLLTILFATLVLTGISQKRRYTYGILDYKKEKCEGAHHQYSTLNGCSCSLTIMNGAGEKLLEFESTKLYVEIHFIPESDTGLIIIYPQAYRQRMAYPALHGKYGFITKQGKLTMPPVLSCSHWPEIEYKNYRFRGGAYLRYGLALVKEENNQFYYIDASGNKVLPKDGSYYTMAYPFEACDCARVSTKRPDGDIASYLIDTDGQPLFQKYPTYHMGMFGNDWTYPLSSGYAFMASHQKANFMILDPDRVKVFSHARYDTTYSYNFLTMYDGAFTKEGEEGMGIMLMSRDKIDPENPDYFSNTIAREVRLFSYDGQPLSEWHAAPINKLLIWENNQVLVRESKEIVVLALDSSIKIIPKETALPWQSTESSRAYFKDFTLQFTEEDLLEIFKQEFPEAYEPR